MLTRACTIAGREPEALAAMRALEVAAPHSPELARAREAGDAAEMRRAVLGRRLTLLDEVAREGGASAGAVAELRQLVKKLPDQPDYKAMLMFALMTQGDLTEALRLADELTAAEEVSHTVHFNVAQVYRAAGQPERAERHLRGAEQTAENDEDRADAAALRRLLEGQDRAG